MPEATTQRRLLISRYRRTGRHFIEPLGGEIGLDMVLIPGGTFMMGAPEGELESLVREKPQHEVTVPPFAMGRYPATQAQWRIVAGYPQIERKLEPDPSYFKGDNRPVEQVSWEEAVEFCQRLSAQTGRSYRLPSEAEWEYACRAGTATPYHFGETLGDELANYRARDEKIGYIFYKGSYGRGIEGTYRQETTEIEIFPPNDFGLHDMHGNVCEWCEDDRHDSYEGAPEDGSAWLEPSRTDTRKLLRGGSWNDYPRFCRSAYRGFYTRGNRNSVIGFRVCCELPRTLLSS
jgi:formylglycine-generating enzyme required for sulfatase activity